MEQLGFKVFRIDEIDEWWLTNSTYTEDTLSEFIVETCGVDADDYGPANITEIDPTREYMWYPLDKIPMSAYAGQTICTGTEKYRKEFDIDTFEGESCMYIKMSDAAKFEGIPEKPDMLASNYD